MQYKPAHEGSLYAFTHDHDVTYRIKSLGDLNTVMDELAEDAHRAEETMLFVSAKYAPNFPFGIWFRGEPSSETPLTPSIFRPSQGQYYDERGLLWDLERRVAEYQEAGDPLSRLCLAQHYVVPTRVLDWTENALVGIFFATEDADRGDDRPGFFYVLNPVTLNLVTGWKDGKGRLHDSKDWGTLFRAEAAVCGSVADWSNLVASKYASFEWRRHPEIDTDKNEHFSLFDNPIAAAPVWRRPRMRVQSSVCTLHGGATPLWPSPPRLAQGIPQTDNGGRMVYLRFQIPGGEPMRRIRRDLLHFGIHEGSVFPEFDKQRQYFTQIWRKRSAP